MKSARGRKLGPAPERPSTGARKVRRALDNGVSQLDLALDVGCSQAMISSIARGEKTPRSYDLVSAFERVLLVAPREWREFITAAVETIAAKTIVDKSIPPRPRGKAKRKGNQPWMPKRNESADHSAL